MVDMVTVMMVITTHTTKKKYKKTVAHNGCPCENADRSVLNLPATSKARNHKSANNTLLVWRPD